MGDLRNRISWISKHINTSLNTLDCVKIVLMSVYSNTHGNTNRVLQELASPIPNDNLRRSIGNNSIRITTKKKRLLNMNNLEIYTQYRDYCSFLFHHICCTNIYCGKIKFLKFGMMTTKDDETKSIHTQIAYATPFTKSQRKWHTKSIEYQVTPVEYIQDTRSHINSLESLNYFPSYTRAKNFKKLLIIMTKWDQIIKNNFYDYLNCSGPRIEEINMMVVVDAMKAQQWMDVGLNLSKSQQLMNVMQIFYQWYKLAIFVLIYGFRWIMTKPQM